jgi:hypothetical protein
MPFVGNINGKISRFPSIATAYTLLQFIVLEGYFEIAIGLSMPRCELDKCSKENVISVIVITEFSSLLFMCRANSYKTNYRQSTV